MLAGLGGFDIDSNLTNSYHTGAASCMACHGADAVGNLTGGHTLRLFSVEEGDNVQSCNIPACHNGAVETFDFQGKQTIIEGLLAALQGKLQNANVLDAEGYVIPDKMYCQKMMAVVWNFKMVEGDRSAGIHNYDYAKGMLDAGIAYLTSLGF